jgi:hypothetical protein
MATHGIEGHGAARRGPTAALALLALALAACGGDGSSDAPFNPLLSDGTGDQSIVSITLSPAPVVIAAGQNRQLVATASCADGSSRVVTGALSWTTGWSGVATVSASGLVHGVASGNTYVYAQDPATGVLASAAVSVKTLSSITLSPSPVSLPVNGTQPLTATGHFTDASTATLTGLTWTSGSTSIATVTSSGVVTGAGAGSTSVSARDPATGISASVSVTVAVKTLSSITLSPSSLSLAVNGSQQLTATGHYTDGSSATIGGLTWSSTYGTIASVSTSGLVTGVSAGSTYVYAQDPSSLTYTFVYVTVH